MNCPYDKLVSEQHVVCGPCALARAGLVMFNYAHIQMMTKYKELDALSISFATYYYYNDIDYEHWVYPSETNPLLLQPTKERAIVDYIRNEKWCDEGILIEALKSYLMWFRNDEELYKVADFFNVSRDVIDYWINEALTDEEV